MRQGTIGGLLVMTFCLVLAGSAQADYFVRQANHTAAMQMMGQQQPEEFDTISMWYSDGVGRSDIGDTLTALYFLEKGELVMLRHTQKVYVRVPLAMDDLVDKIAAEEGSDLPPEAAEMMKAVMGSSKCEVTPTDETAKVGEWDAKKFDVKLSIMGMVLNHEVWATKDLDIDPRLFHAATNAMMAMMPGMAESISEMSKIDGVPVKTVVSGNIMGAQLSSTSELIEFREGDAPAGTFEIPDGYEETEITGMMGGH